MVFDDGVTMRLAADRFLVTTTTGNAAKVLDWFEEWLQTEWPELRVHCTSVTEQWATVAIAGPRSRDVVASLAPDLAVDAEAFPFMAIREATVAGLAARVCRVSFSGELAFEVNVPGWHGLALWEAAWEAGQPYGDHPVRHRDDARAAGREGLRDRRAGHRRDGHAAGPRARVGWSPSARATSSGAARTGAPTRRARTASSSSGCCRRSGCPRARSSCATPRAPEPVPMDGHVTSSYDSAALGRPFALALLRRGRERHGETVHVPLIDRTVTARVVDPVFYDPEGTRRDGT